MSIRKYAGCKREKSTELFMICVYCARVWLQCTDEAIRTLEQAAAHDRNPYGIIFIAYSFSLMDVHVTYMGCM